MQQTLLLIFFMEFLGSWKIKNKINSAKNKNKLLLHYTYLAVQQLSVGSESKDV
jgi:hypothetical protein